MVDELVNPYIAGAPVTEARMFFGREDVFDWIQNSLVGKYADHILVIHGQRRVGKTSVLKQLGNRLPKRYVPVFFDLQGRTHTTLDRFLWWLAREIVRVLKQERGIEIPVPEKEDFAKDLEHFENRFLPDLQPALDGLTLLLTFDEFDNLEDPEIKDELGSPLVDHLRRLMGRQGLNFIFSIGSSGRKLENMQASYTDFFKTALYKKISFLNEEQTNNLITCPVEGILEYDRHAVNRIYRLAGGHPYFTQLTCHELFAGCQRTGETHIREKDVESVLDDVVERGTVNLKFVWDEASDIEKWALSSLAHLDKPDSRSLAAYLHKQNVRFSESDLTSGLLHLREKDVLTPENRFVIHLLRLWLQKNRPIEQVREELTEVNPIANRYIEIGLEFKNSGQHEKAIESFQEALAVSAENVQAQVSIALVYMDQKVYDKAVGEFEKALAMDDEDISARSGLCEAHLALGDSAMTRGRMKEAVLSFQRVLSINAEHTEARGRMAEISRQRAEKAWSNGRDEEALSAFTEALRFTPEDPVLTARVEQFRTEKKAKILALLLASSEKEALAKNWDGAVRSLEEALTLSPDDETIIRKLADAKTTQAKEAALSAVYAEAQKAYIGKDYDQAVSLFKKIILEDENFRDASRLLMQAIELRRTAPKWWQRKALQAAERTPLPRSRPRVSLKKMGLIGAVSILVLGLIGGLFWFAKNGLPAIFAPAADNTTTPTGTGSPVLTPTPALDPDIQDALDTIQNEEPLYQTSFDDWDFEDHNQNAALVNGKLILTSEDENGSYFALNAYPSDRYVVEYEVSIPSSNGVCFYGAGNGVPPGESFRGFTTEFLPGEDLAVLARYVHQTGLDERMAAASFDKTESNVVTLVVLGDQITAFINGQLALSAKNPAGSVVYVEYGFAAHNQATCEFDYFKYWDLREMDPAVKTALAAIQSEEPLYQTSFDDWDSDGTGRNAALVNGKLILTSEDENGATLGLNVYSSDSYFVEFEFSISEDTPADGLCVYEATSDAQFDEESWRAFSAEFWPGEDSAVLSIFDPQSREQPRIATTPFDKTKSNVVRLVVIKDQITAFINGQLAYIAQDPAGSVLYFGNNLAAYNQATCEFDYFKYWDLRELDPAVKTAFAAISREEPLFQTSFDAWDFGNLVKNASIEDGKLIIASDNQEGPIVNLNNHASDKFAIQYDLRILGPGRQDATCHFLTQNDIKKAWSESWRALAAQFANSHALLGRWTKTEITDFVSAGDVYSSKASTVTLFILEDQITAFHNGKIIFATLDPDGSVVYTHHALSAYGGNVCEYDNYKYWDLSDADFSATTNTTTVQASFFGSALASISDKTPDYEDDFSNLASGWPTDRFEFHRQRIRLPGWCIPHFHRE
jgi:tetratricopeptide (TPR) repeat protein